MVSKENLEEIRRLLDEDGDTTKSDKVKVKNIYLFGRFLWRSEVTFLGGRKKWVH